MFNVTTSKFYSNLNIETLILRVFSLKMKIKEKIGESLKNSMPILQTGEIINFVAVKLCLTGFRKSL
mgnify:CR=1 FL=1